MKKETVSKGTLVYDNEFGWKHVWEALWYAFLYSSWLIPAYIIISTIAYIGGGVPFFEGIERRVIGFIGMVLFIFMFYALLYFHRIKTGRYSIVGNNLIVHERFFFSKVDLTIPLAKISEVQYIPRFIGWRQLKNIARSGIATMPYIPYSFLAISIKGQSYILYCVTHTKELYEELQKRVENNNTNQ